MSQTAKRDTNRPARRQIWIRADLCDLIEAIRGTTPKQYKADELIESALRQRRLLPAAAESETAQPAA